ncbi:MAG: tetratricopeptide repeat protein [Patescibacteria group bacterium]
MFTLVLILLFAAVSAYSLHTYQKDPDDIPHRLGNRMARLWDVAQVSMREGKLMRSEKALLTILKIDEKNAAAYNRLGILYAKQKEYDDAIDCFEIASTLDRTASSLHNLGLIYFETDSYEKAGIAFKQALELEDTLAARHIAYAKVLERQGKTEEMVERLEMAVSIEENQETLGLLKKAYKSAGDETKEKAIDKKLRTLITPSGKKRRVRKPVKAVIQS